MSLTATTGLIDAVCYLGMGHVLVANMTGNIVFLRLALAGGEGVHDFVVPGGARVLRRRRHRRGSARSDALLATPALADLDIGNSGRARRYRRSRRRLRVARPGRHVAPLGDRTARRGYRHAKLDSEAGSPGSHDLGSHDDDHWDRCRLCTRERSSPAPTTPVGLGRGDVGRCELVGGILVVQKGFSTTLDVLAGVLTLVSLSFATVPEGGIESSQQVPAPRISPGASRFRRT